MQTDGNDLPILPFTAVRLSQLDRLIQIRLKTRSGLLSPSRFTLHSMIGQRLPGGRLQMERIAGFCHLRGCLKCYAAEQLEAVQDPENGDDIDDLSAWLASRQVTAPAVPDMRRDAVDKRVAAREAAVKVRHVNSVALAIDKAIVCASSRGLDEVAERLLTLLRTLDARPTETLPDDFGRTGSFWS